MPKPRTPRRKQSRAPRSSRLAADLEKFRKIFEVSLDPVTINGWTDGRYRDVNEEFLQLTGYSREEVIDRTPAELGIWHDLGALRTVVGELQAHLLVRNREFEFRMKDGTVQPALFSALVTDIDGELCVLSFVRNIADRKQTEDALRRSEEKYRQLVEASQDVIWSLDLEGRVTFVNQAAKQIYGHGPEEMTGRPFTDWIRSEDLEREQDVFRRRFERPERFIHEAPYRRSDGKLVWLSSTAVPLRDETGRVCGLTGISRDVTELKLAEQALRESEEKYRALFEESKDAVFTTTPDDRVADINPAGVELLGYPSKEALLRVSISRDVYADPADRASFVARIAAEGFVKDHELTVKTFEGSKLDVLVTASAIRDELGRVVAFRGILRDVTGQKQLEAQLRQAQKLEAIGLLAAGVAHEINNPLTYVITNLDTVLTDLPRLGDPRSAGELRASVEARLGDAAEGADRVRRIVRDLKTFSRLEAERRGPVEVRSVVEKAIAMAGNQIRYRAHLVTELTPVPPVLASEGRLTQVFLNLLINAAQAIEEGNPSGNEVRVRASFEDGEVRVIVADTGRGILPEHLDRLFDPFFTTKPAGEGSGLGLSICRNIVTSYGGKVEVESEPGHGSRFVVRLPPAAAVCAAAPASGGAIPATPTQRRGRVLVVDDEPMVCSTARLILEAEHDVIVAGGGREALELLTRDRGFDVILCDLMMPEVSGMDLHAALVADVPEIARRFVFVTGGAFTAQAQQFLERAANPCVEKPFAPADILEVVRGVIARR